MRGIRDCSAGVCQVMDFSCVGRERRRLCVDAGQLERGLHGWEEGMRSGLHSFALF